MKNKKKLLVVLACLALCVCTVVTGTLAWLTAESETVTNTFAPSDIALTLTESNLNGETNPLLNAYKMIPGDVLPKDPTVTVTADIASYVFIKVEEVNNPYHYLDYSIAAGWIPLVDANNDNVADDGIYYREVDTNGTFSVLTGDKVTVRSTITVADMTTAKNNPPELKFTAYAIQQANIPDSDNDGIVVDDAWTLASAQQNP